MESEQQVVTTAKLVAFAAAFCCGALWNGTWVFLVFKPLKWYLRAYKPRVSCLSFGIGARNCFFEALEFGGRKSAAIGKLQ